MSEFVALLGVGLSFLLMVLAVAAVLVVLDKGE